MLISEQQEIYTIRLGQRPHLTGTPGIDRHRAEPTHIICARVTLVLVMWHNCAHHIVYISSVTKGTPPSMDTRRLNGHATAPTNSIPHSTVITSITIPTTKHQLLTPVTDPSVL